MKAWIPVIVVLICGWLGGCAWLPTRRAPEVPPQYRPAAEMFNARLHGLDRLWSRATVRLKYRGDDGKRHVEQGEGHLQLILPSKIALSIGKLGETYAYLGCNEAEYWWMELHDGKKAWVGSNDTAATIDEHVPVHPMDVIQLLALTPLDAEDPAATAEWSRDGRRIGLSTRTDRAMRRLWVRARDGAPMRVELLDEAGQLVVSSDLSGVREVETPLLDIRRIPLYDTAVIRVPERDTEIRLVVIDPQSTNKRPNEAAFDLDRLLDAYGIDEIERLEPSEPPMEEGA